jgi:two-component system, chemotaxis family, protein-glutamate methylesterase/glutaminase
MHPPQEQPIKVLIVDDSAMVRRAISDALGQDKAIEVVGVANDPFIAREKILKLNPDVLTLDIEMPRMDGLTFLKILAQYHPMPVVVISSLTEAGSDIAMQCMEAGAAQVLAKPDGSMSIGVLGAHLAHHVKAAYQVGIGRRRLLANASQHGAAASDTGDTVNAVDTRANTQARPLTALPAKQDKGTPPAQPHTKAAPTLVRVPPPKETTGVHIASRINDQRLLVIGASAGGVEALRGLIPKLPANCPPCVVVQHIPAHFSKVLAQRINATAHVEVREAVDGDVLKEGLCLIAPGGFHTVLVRSAQGYAVRLTQTPPVHFCRPAVDVLFKSAARAAGEHTTAVLLTGMGSDGAQGMLDVLHAGGDTLAEDESTCVVFGMPRAAGLLNAVRESVPLPDMAQAIARSLNRVGA